MQDDRPQPDEDESLPQRLREEMARLFPSVPVPPSVDAEILSRAKAGYSRRVRFRPVIRWVSVAAAIAAVVTLVFVARTLLIRPAPEPMAIDTGPSRHLQGDIDGDGKVNMLDAYILARRVASGAKPDPAWDVNGDGVVDQRDVDWIANSAVSLGATGGKSGGAAQ